MNQPDTRAARAAFEDLLALRRPVDDLAQGLLPFLTRTHRGWPVATVTRAAVAAAITAYQAGDLTGAELRAWAILVHGEIAPARGRSPYLRLEPRSRLIVHAALDELIEHLPEEYSPKFLEPITRSLTHTDIGFLTRLPGVGLGIELAAMALWGFVIGPPLVTAVLDDWLACLVAASIGGQVVGVAVARGLAGPETAIARLQVYWPIALLALAVLGAAKALGIGGPP